MPAGKSGTRPARLIAGGSLAAVAALTALAGCGSGGTASGQAKPTVAALVHTMRNDFRHATSLRMAGHLRQQGRRVALDIGLLRSGDFEGTVVLSGARVRVLRSGTRTYAFVSRSFFRYLHDSRGVPAAACSVICGKYLKVPAGAIPDVSLASLAGQITRNASVPKGKAKVTVTTFAGKPAYKVSRSGQAAFFAKNGHHYLIGFQSGKQDASVTFTQWNAVPPVSPPPASKVVSSG